MLAPELILTCSKGTEKALMQELKVLGHDCQEGQGTVYASFESWPLAVAALAQVRVADRALVSLGKLSLRHPDQLLEKARSFPWEDYLRPEETFKFNAVFSQSAKAIFKNSLYCSQVLKDSVVDRLRDKTGKRPSVDLMDPIYPFSAYFTTDDQAGLHVELSLDIAGGPLSKRGYRQTKHQAPLKENLAAALLYQIQDFKPGLYADLMCGSGTFVVEAAWMLAGIPPQFLRLKSFIEHGQAPFALFTQRFLPPKVKAQAADLLKKLYDDAKAKLDKGPTCNLWANDSSFKSIEEAKVSFQKAEIFNWVELTSQDACSVAPVKHSGRGVVTANPPYGHRLQQDDELETLYYEFGENLKKNFKDFDAYIVIPEVELRKAVSLRTSSNHIFYNGPLECRWSHYKLY